MPASDHLGLLADQLLYLAPWRQFLREELMTGRFPLWNPFILSGVPFAACIQAAPFYPLNLGFFWLPAVAFSLTAAFLKIFCGTALLVGLWPETVGALSAGLCLVFVLMLGQAMLRGLELKCGCLGEGDSGWFDRPPVALARAALMLCAAVWSWLKSGVAGVPAPVSVAS